MTPLGFNENLTEFSYILKFDGLCGPVNPGGITIGSYLIYTPDGNLVVKGGEVICRETGESTNNTAEWAGLVLGLRKLKSFDVKSLQIVGDSKVVIDSLKHTRKPGAEHLLKWKKEAHNLLKDYDWVSSHVLRAFNAEADSLGNEIYDAELKANPFDNKKLSKDHWTNGKPSQKQLDYLVRLGITEIENITKGEASNLISKAKKTTF